MVISKPFAGWVTFTFAHDTGMTDFSASYLTDVPLDLLDSAIEYLKYHKSVCIDFDAEGRGSWHLILSEYDCYIIDDGTRITRHLKQDGDEIIKDILTYINMYLDDWVDWLCYDEHDNKDVYNDILSNKFYILKVLFNNCNRIHNYNIINKEELLNAIYNFCATNPFQTCEICPCKKLCYNKYKPKPDYMNCCDIFEEWLYEESENNTI